MIRWFKKKKRQVAKQFKWFLLDRIRLEMAKIIRIPQFWQDLTIEPLHRNGETDREINYDGIALLLTMPSWNKVRFDVLWGGLNTTRTTGGINFTLHLLDPLMIRLACREFLVALMGYSLKFNETVGLNQPAVHTLFWDLKHCRRPTVTPWNDRPRNQTWQDWIV